jgi:hypothetical protein
MQDGGQLCVLLAESDCDYVDSVDCIALQGRVNGVAGYGVQNLRLRQEEAVRFPNAGGYIPSLNDTPSLCFGPLMTCSTLRTLELTCLSCWVDGLEHVTQLVQLHVNWGVKHIDKSFQDLSFLSGYHNLETLSITGCGSLTNIDALGGSMSLRKCHLGAPNLRSIGPLRTCDALEELIIEGCPIVDVSPLQTCTSLERVLLVSLRQLVDIQPLRMCPVLMSITLYGCYEVIGDDSWHALEFRPNDFRFSGWCPSHMGMFREVQCPECVASYLTGEHVFVEDYS